MVDSSVIAAIAAVVGCLVVTLVFSLLAVAVHRRATTATRASTARGGGCGTAASRAAWSKVATADMTGIDSPLYSAVVNSGGTTTSVAGRTSNGKMTELCCEGPDIILTLESEPVNYAVSSSFWLCSMAFAIGASKGAITSKIKHAIKLKTSPATLA